MLRPFHMVLGSALLTAPAIASCVLVSGMDRQPRANDEVTVAATATAILPEVSTLPPSAQEVGEPASLASPPDCLPERGGCTEATARPVVGAVEATHAEDYQVGRPLDFVCRFDIPAEDDLADHPNLQLMWEHYVHQSPKGVWREVGGMVAYNGELPTSKGGWVNACTVRLSHMLNAAGLKIPRMPGKTVTGGSGENYLFRLRDAEAFLTERLGEPDYEWTDGYAWADDMPPVPGLIIMKFPDPEATGHATVWNGAGTVDGSEIGGTAVYFWELPCYRPLGRKAGKS